MRVTFRPQLFLQNLFLDALWRSYSFNNDKKKVPSLFSLFFPCSYFFHFIIYYTTIYLIFSFAFFMLWFGRTYFLGYEINPCSTRYLSFIFLCAKAVQWEKIRRSPHRHNSMRMPQVETFVMDRHFRARTP